MATNFSIYNTRTERLNVADLEVGQTLIRVNRPESRFGTLTGKFSTEEYTVVKVLKTRLVLESKEVRPALRPGLEPKKHEIRLLVESSKWSIRNGEVTATKEGDSGHYNVTSYDFATVDEPVIEQLRNDYEERMQAQKIKNEARAAIDAIKGQLHPNLDSVLEAMSALGALADVLRAEQR